MPPSTQRAVLDASAPAFEQSAIRTLVHKRFPDNVLLTDLRACADDHFICTGRIPIDHPFFNDGGRTPVEDVLFYTELGRQTSIAVSHAFLNVGLDDVFIFERSEAAVTEAIWSLPSTAESVVIEIKIRETVRRKNNALSRAVADYFMFAGNELVFSGIGTWTIQSAALFKRLRKALLEASSPVSVEPPDSIIEEGPDPSRPYPSNIVISAPEFQPDGTAVAASLIVDHTHPFFFDHPCDHVPGMLMLEGCAQQALAAVAEWGLHASGRLAVVAYNVDFTQFAERGLPTILTAQMAATDGGAPAGTLPAIDITISQRGVVSGTARMSVGVSR